MDDSNPAVEAARISYRRAVAVALIGALAGILTTWLGTHGIRMPDSGTAKAGMIPGSASPPNDAASQVVKLTTERDALQKKLDAATTEAPRISSAFVPATVEQNTCLEWAAKVLTDNGGAALQKTTNAVFAHVGPVQLEILCLPSQKNAIIVAAGADKTTSEAERNKIANAFKAVVQ